VADVRPVNRRNVLRLKVFGVRCRFDVDAAGEAARPQAAGAEPGAADLSAVAPETGAGRAAAADAAGAPSRDPLAPQPAPAGAGAPGTEDAAIPAHYADWIARLYRADRVVRVQRGPGRSLQGAPMQAPPPAGGRPQPPAAAAPGPEATALGELLDVGGGGARFAVRDADWSIRPRRSGRLFFELAGEPFRFACHLVRKTDNGSRFEYVAVWHRPRTSDVDRLIRAIYRVELARRQAQGSLAAPRGPSARRRGGSHRRIAAFAAFAGLMAAGLAGLLAGPDAPPLWGGLALAALIAGLLPD
jgi:hypothetical protein